MKKPIKLISLIISIFILSACFNKNHLITLRDVVNDTDQYEDEVVTLKGHLYITEMLYKSFYSEPNSEFHLDLSLDNDKLPDGVTYSSGNYYCVTVVGTFKQYSEDFLALNSRSKFGRIAVDQIKLCGNQ